MATNYVLCPSCNRNHCREYFDYHSQRNVINKNDSKEECKICRITNAYRKNELRDFGKNHSDCRFLIPSRLSHYHRRIPGYGDAVDFDLPIHTWNCAGHSHCKHGTLGTIEERALTMLKSNVEQYVHTYNNCVCRPSDVACRHVFC